MADIGVEPRSGPGLWPWIAGILIVALLVWGLTTILGGDDDVVVEEAVPTAPAEPR